MHRHFDIASPLLRNICVQNHTHTHTTYIYTYTHIRLPSSSDSKEFALNVGDPGSIPGSGRFSGEGIGYPLQYSWASCVAQLVKNLPGMWETWVWSLGWEDPWRRERLPTPVFWPWRMGVSKLDTTERLSLSAPFHIAKICLHFCLSNRVLISLVHYSMEILLIFKEILYILVIKLNHMKLLSC